LFLNAVDDGPGNREEEGAVIELWVVSECCCMLYWCASLIGEVCRCQIALCVSKVMSLHCGTGQRMCTVALAGTERLAAASRTVLLCL